MKRAFLFARRQRICLTTLLNNKLAFLALSDAYLLREAKRFWIIERPQLWFENAWNDAQFNDMHDYWRQEFRLSKKTFRDVIDIVIGDMQRSDTKFRKAIAIEKRVAIALWRLSTGSSFRSTAPVFGVGKSSAVQITATFCSCIAQRAGRYIKFPSNEREAIIALEKFSEGCKLPQVIGAIDATHVETVAPEDNPSDYLSRKQKYTINTQAVVGANEIFLDVATGFPGSIHDARVLRASTLYRKAENSDILTRPIIRLNSQPIRPIIIGDGAYLSKSWLVKPYPYNIVLSMSQRAYNRTFSSARSIVERAFGLLKSWWRCLLKRLDNKTNNVSNTIITCCILHNLCQTNGDGIEDEEFLRRILIRERTEDSYMNHTFYETTGENLRELLEAFINE